MDDESAELAEYSAFYMENVPRLINFLVSQGWQISDASDRVQETMIDALPPTWASLEDPYAWCRKVAYRKACKQASRQSEAVVSDPEITGSLLIAANIDVEYLEARHELLYWLAQLRGDKQREVLVWTYDGATPAEIAAELEMSPATVRSTLRNARAALRRLQKGDDQE